MDIYSDLSRETSRRNLNGWDMGRLSYWNDNVGEILGGIEKSVAKRTVK